jgi:Na+/H+ antiporter NhaD/arsenite permease-like protein
MLWTNRRDVHLALRHVEWDTLIFFAALFIVVRCFVELRLIDSIGDFFKHIIGSVDGSEAQLHLAMFTILWVSGIASAFIDNIPYTLTCLPIIIKLSRDADLQLPLRPLALCLAIGADLGGNGTLVASAVNVLAANIAKENGKRISFMQFFKVGFPSMLISLACSSAYMHVVFGFLAIGRGASLYEMEEE